MSSVFNSRPPTLLNLGSIFRMDTLEMQLIRRLVFPWVKAKDCKELPRPSDFSGADVPTPSSGTTEFLPFRQVSLTAPQCLLSSLLFGQVENESNTIASAAFKECAAEQHGNPATIFQEELFLVGPKDTGCL